MKSMSSQVILIRSILSPNALRKQMFSGKESLVISEMPIYSSASGCRMLDLSISGMSESGNKPWGDHSRNSVIKPQGGRETCMLATSDRELGVSCILPALIIFSAI
jgi:hypothetical protein